MLVVLASDVTQILRIIPINNLCSSKQRLMTNKVRHLKNNKNTSQSMLNKMEINEPALIKNLYKKLILSDYHIFPKKGKINITEKHGVYIIYNPNNEVLHVGNTPSGRKGLNQRLYNHISSTGIFYEKYLKPNKIKMRGIYKFRYLEVEDIRHRAFLEAYTAGKLCPAHFGTGAKKIV